MIDTVIFDLDGLLADTEALHRQAYQEVLKGYGVVLADDYYDEHWIRTGKGIADFARANNLSSRIADIRREKGFAYRRLVLKSAKAMPWAVELLDMLKDRKTLALATSSYADAADAVITALNIRSYFKVIAAYESVSNVKPYPDIFLHVACLLNVAPGSCLVMEDSEKGVLAAYAAGMHCIAVPNRHTKWHDFSKATLLVSSLKDVTLGLIDSLAR